jgi:hypothetical protein
VGSATRILLQERVRTVGTPTSPSRASRTSPEASRNRPIIGEGLDRRRGSVGDGSSISIGQRAGKLSLSSSCLYTSLFESAV